MSETNLVPYLALLFVQIIFGLNLPVSKVIISHFEPLPWAAIRMGIAAVLMFGCSFFIVPKNQRRVDFEFLTKTFLFGFFGLAMCQSLFLLGLQNTTITNSAVLNTLTPIFTLMFAILMGKERFTRNRVLGFIVAFAGILVLRRVEDFSVANATLKGDVLTILNCVFLALFFSVSGEFMKANSAFWATAWMFLFSSITVGLVCLTQLPAAFEVVMTPQLWGAVAYNIIGATMIAYFLNSWTLKKVAPSSVALFFYFQPLVAVLYLWMVQSELPSIRTFVAIFCIFLGVVLAVVKGVPKEMKRSVGTL